MRSPLGVAASALAMALCLSLAAGGLARAGDPDVARVEIATDDGFTIVGDYLAPRAAGSGEKAAPAPAIVLAPMLGHTRETYAPLVKLASMAGYASLALDLRGHGESTRCGEKKVSHKDFGPEEWRGAALDLKAAVAFLRKDKRVDPARIGIVGASIGANLALAYAAEDKAVKAVVLLSPGLEYRGVTTEAPMKAYGKRPVLLVAGGKSDRYSSDTVEALSALAQGAKTVKVLEDAGHGTDLFERSADLPALVVEWLSKQL